MTDPFLFSIAKTIASPIAKVASYAYAKLRRPSVGYRRAPKNLFEHVKPGTSLAKMKEVLGTPNQESDGQYRYVFAEACVQVDCADGVSIDSVSVGLCGVTRWNRFQIWPIHDLILGKTTFLSIIESSDEVTFDSSSKFFHFYVVKYYGFPGLYWNYAVGVLECPGVFPDKHHWSPNAQSRDEIPREMKINWACVTRRQEPPSFSYYGFL
jgi:hypothetical protein